MPDSVLQIIQDAMDELSLPRLASVVGSSDPMARQMLSLFNAHGKELASDTDWTILDRVNVFPTVVDQAEYDLPGDFDHLVINTVWDRSQLTPVRGPISPAMWQTIKSGLIGNGIYFRRYRIVRGVNMAVRKFVIDPTPGTSGADLVFEYISNAWVSLNDGSSICTRVTNDTAASGSAAAAPCALCAVVGVPTSVSRRWALKGGIFALRSLLESDRLPAMRM